MKIGKTLYVVLLTVFCLAIMVITAIPTRSSVGGYDPVLDINHDGVINMKDLGTVARAFNPLSTGNDPTVPVNVTSIPASTAELDLNISLIPAFQGLSGNSWTGRFVTAGYDRMFVSAAIIGLSDYSLTWVQLLQANWTWGMINGTYLETSTFSGSGSDSNNQLVIVYEDGLPVSSGHAAEFAIKATQCRLWFNAQQRDSTLTSGWVLIHISVYLTVGTTSPPSIQDTYVTNWPQAAPYSLQTGTLNISSEGGWINPIISCGGYSRLSIGLVPRGANLGAGNNVTIYLAAIMWTTTAYSSIGYSYDSLDTNAINITVYDGGGASVPKSFITENKAPYCELNFAPLNVPPSPKWWVTFDYAVYLRNE